MIMDRKDFVAGPPEAALTFTMTGVDDQYVFNPSDPLVFLLGSSVYQTHSPTETLNPL